ncbi:LPXTG-motif cell wall-anchored protein [Babesia caballi]|uniref:LPXTG-motif cell wall-anchored protein n=1 Tax=Babesia caballi TaxID=5871 RepID=A0AAV4LPN5_BABCB|nr:LPXTG-motif cell wall-anchored protein [Babesia caballi]
MTCNIDIRDQGSLRECLELFDVLHKSVGGATQGIKNVFDKTFPNDIAAFDNFQFALENAGKLRAGIVGYGKVYNYGSYEKLRNSGNDEACGYRIISILKKLLPKLIKTLQFFLGKVGRIEEGYWGGQRCDGHTNSGLTYTQNFGGKDLYLWLTDQNPYPSDSLKRSYRGYWLSPQTGNGLKGSLEALVDGNNGHLQKLEGYFTSIPNYVPSHQSHHSPHANSHRSPQSSPAPPHPRQPASPQYQPHAYQDSSSQHEERSEETQPSQNGADGSTATIGGVAGAAGLVGGGAAVYFLNVGGIRTLIAG